jgi:hypothetical protein
MAQMDLEIVYLILTKVARGEVFYTYDPSQKGPGQTPGTITAKELAQIYQRITGRPIGSRVNWNTPLDQLNLFLSHCGLPALGKLVLQEGGAHPSSGEALTKVRNTQWPTFSALKNLYRK